jgi:hypothetical protein
MRLTTLVVILLCSLLLGCANSGEYVDLGKCGTKAAAMKAAIEYDHPGSLVEIVPGTMKGVSHVEVMALINGNWVWAYWIHMDYKADIIDFYPERPPGFELQGEER